jgi:hypothetical protein
VLLVGRVEDREHTDVVVDPMLGQQLRRDRLRASSAVLGRDLALEVHVGLDDAHVDVERGNAFVGAQGVFHLLREVLRRVVHCPRVAPGVSGANATVYDHLPSGYHAPMPVPQSDELLDAMKQVAAILRESDVPFALSGGLAAWALGGPPTEHDVDFTIREADADRALEALDHAGIHTERPPEGWLVKAWVDDVLVDLIYRPSGIDVDDEFFDRCAELSVAAVRMRVMGADDIFRTKLLALSEHNLDLEPLLSYARALREQVDWSDVSAAVESSPFARTFMFLARELGIVPSPPLHALPGEAEQAQPANAKSSINATSASG